MKKKDFQKQYVQLKEEYNQLLDKNQNDLVKIRIREKTLNDRIIEIQKQRQLEVKALKQLIQSMQTEIESLKYKIRTDDRSKQQQKAHSKMINDKNVIPNKLVSKRQDTLNQMLQAQDRKYRDDLSKLRSQFDQKQAQYQHRQLQNKKIINQLMRQIQEYNNEYELNFQTNKAYQEELKTKKEDIINKNEFIKGLYAEINELKNHLKQSQKTKQCLNCIRLDQQLQLQAQITKSVRTMLRFKEMELQNFKK